MDSQDGQRSDLVAGPVGAGAAYRGHGEVCGEGQSDGAGEGMLEGFKVGHLSDFGE